LHDFSHWLGVSSLRSAMEKIKQLGSLIYKHLEQMIAVAIAGTVAMLYRYELLAFVQKEKSELTAHLLILIVVILFYLSALYCVKIIKEKFSYLEYRENLFWAKDDPHPFCPTCKNKDESRRRLLKTGEAMVLTYECKVCHYEFNKVMNDTKFSVIKSPLS